VGSSALLVRAVYKELSNGSISASSGRLSWKVAGSNQDWARTQVSGSTSACGDMSTSCQRPVPASTASSWLAGTNSATHSWPSSNSRELRRPAARR